MISAIKDLRGLSRLRVAWKSLMKSVVGTLPVLSMLDGKPCWAEFKDSSARWRLMMEELEKLVEIADLRY